MKSEHSAASEAATFPHSIGTFLNCRHSTRIIGPSSPNQVLFYICSYVYSESLPPSKREYPIQGLNLIRLLTQNRIADFHTTLETLDANVIAENPFIKHPVNLERWLMEGSYSKVWNAREEAPAEEYKFFVDSLMGTIRYVNFNVVQSTGLDSAVGMKSRVVRKPPMKASPSKTLPHCCFSRINPIF